VLTEDLARRRAEGELLATRERRLREQMESVAARAHTDREETLRLARDMVQSAEDARLAVVDEMDRLRAALAAEQASLVEIEQERAIVTQDAAVREAELGRARQMIEQLEASRLNANGELARARAKLVETESELLAAQHEYQLSQVQIDKLCSAHDELVEDRAQLVARLHEAKEREARLRLRITGLEQRIQAVHEGVVTNEQTAPETALDATASGLALELSRSEERARVLESELVKAKAAASAASLRVDALQDQARKAEQARIAAETEMQSRHAAANAPRPVPLAADVEGEAAEPIWGASLQEPIAAAVEPIALVEEEVAAGVPIEDAVEPLAVADACTHDERTTDAFPGDEPTDDADACTPVELEPMVVLDEPIEDVVAPAPSAAPVEPMTEVAASVAVIDTAGTWPSDGSVGAHVLAPGDATCGRVRELAPACCLVNLGEAGAIEAAAALRAGDLDTPLFGYVADHTNAIALGIVDVVTRPVDPERVRARLAALASHGANVIMVGSESGILIPLRQGVQQAGMSVKTAWNRTQAVQLADTVNPDIVIIDVASERECAALLCDLGRRAPAPKLVLVLGTPAQQDELRAALIAQAGASTVDRTALLHAAIAAARS
jgi:CheY-like chemotaxis protein